MTELASGSGSSDMPRAGGATAGLGDYRWSGYSLAQKQAWMRDGQGFAAVVPGMDFLNSLASTFNESEDHLRGTLAELGVHWSGSGASAACESLRGVLDWAGGLRITATGAGAGLGQYGDSFAQVKLQIPGLLEIDAQAAPTSDLAAVNGLQGDLRAGPAAASRADQAVNAALAAHERITREVLAAFPDPRTQPAAAGPAPAAPPTSSTSTSTSDDSDQKDQSDGPDGHQHDVGAFGAMPIMPPMMGGGGYQTVPSRPGRLVDPADGPFVEPAAPDSTEAGGVVSPPEPVATEDTVKPRPRATEWTSSTRETESRTGRRTHPFFNDEPAPTNRVEPLPPPVDRRLPLLGSTAGTEAGKTGPGLPLGGLAGRLRRPLRGLNLRSPAAEPDSNAASESDSVPGQPKGDDYVNKIDLLDEPNPVPEPAVTPGPTVTPEPAPAAEPARPAGPLDAETTAIPCTAAPEPAHTETNRRPRAHQYPRQPSPQPAAQPAPQQTAAHQPAAQPRTPQPAARRFYSVPPQPSTQPRVQHPTAQQPTTEHPPVTRPTAQRPLPQHPLPPRTPATPTPYPYLYLYPPSLRQPTPEPQWSNGYPQQAEYGYPQPKYPDPRYSEQRKDPADNRADNRADNAGYDSEFDAEFDRELGMDFDERHAVPPVLGPPRTPADPRMREDRL